MNDIMITSEISYSQVDSGMHVTLTALAKLIEDATTKFLMTKNLSGAELNNIYHAIIVVLRNHIYFHKRIHLGDIIQAKVDVIKKSSVAFILRTNLFRISEYDPSVTSYIQLSSIDMQTRRLRNLDDFKSFHSLDVLKEDFPLKGIFNKYTQYNKEPEKEREVLVESTDIDYSNHLNNISYIRYFLNMLKSRELRHLPYKEMEVNYIKEAREGEKVVIGHTKDDNDMYFRMRDMQGNILTKAKITL